MPWQPQTGGIGSLPGGSQPTFSLGQQPFNTGRGAAFMPGQYQLPSSPGQFGGQGAGQAPAQPPAQQYQYQAPATQQFNPASYNLPPEVLASMQNVPFNNGAQAPSTPTPLTGMQRQTEVDQYARQMMTDQIPRSVNENPDPNHIIFAGSQESGAGTDEGYNAANFTPAPTFEEWMSAPAPASPYTGAPGDPVDWQQQNASQNRTGAPDDTTYNWHGNQYTGRDAFLTGARGWAEQNNYTTVDPAEWLKSPGSYGITTPSGRNPSDYHPAGWNSTFDGYAGGGLMDVYRRLKAGGLI